MTHEEKELLRGARTIIRDLATGWAVKELHEPPEVLVDKITKALGDRYDFEAGEESDAD